MNDKKTLLSNKIWRTKNSHKRTKLSEQPKKNASPDGIVFLQEIHSPEKDQIRWNDEFKS